MRYLKKSLHAIGSAFLFVDGLEPMSWDERFRAFIALLVSTVKPLTTLFVIGTFSEVLGAIAEGETMVSTIFGELAPETALWLVGAAHFGSNTIDLFKDLLLLNMQKNISDKKSSEVVRASFLSPDDSRITREIYDASLDIEYLSDVLRNWEILLTIVGLSGIGIYRLRIGADTDTLGITSYSAIFLICHAIFSIGVEGVVRFKTDPIRLGSRKEALLNEQLDAFQFLNSRKNFLSRFERHQLEINLRSEGAMHYLNTKQYIYNLQFFNFITYGSELAFGLATIGMILNNGVQSNEVDDLVYYITAFVLMTTRAKLVTTQYDKFCRMLNAWREVDEVLANNLPPADGPNNLVPIPVPEAPILRLDQVTLTIQGNAILNNVSFEIQPGEIVCVLVGKSGAGKTSLLNLISGFQTPTAGQIQFKGINISAPANADQQRLKAFSTTRQQDEIFKDRSVKFNVLYGCQNVAGDTLYSLLDNPNADQQHDMLYDNLCNMCAIPNDLKNRPNSRNLSGGETQRVLLARTLARNSELYIFDEPTTGLDPVMADTVFANIVHYLNHLQRAALIVTHDMCLAQAANRIFILHNKQLLDFPRGQIPSYGGHHVGLYAESVNNTYRNLVNAQLINVPALAAAPVVPAAPGAGH